MKPIEFIWERREGRDRDGDKFATWLLLHGSGRILARVIAPSADEFAYRVHFNCKVPDRILRDSWDEYEFIDEYSAKRFVEQTLAQFNPLPRSAKKKSGRRTRVRR